MSTPSSLSSDEEFDPRPNRENRVAKKSTASAAGSSSSTSAASSSSKYATRQTRSKNQKAVVDKFLENFNPDTSVREKRKLIRKINPPSNVRRPVGALFDEHGVHINSGLDLCDCLVEDCVGCFFDCPKCGSPKCGTECRVHRKYVVEQIEYHGYDHVIKNTLQK